MIKKYLRFKDYIHEDVRFYTLPSCPFGNFKWDNKEDFLGLKISWGFWTLYLGYFYTPKEDKVEIIPMSDEFIAYAQKRINAVH